MSSVKIRIERLERARATVTATTALILVTEGGELTSVQERDRSIARQMCRPVLQISLGD